MIVITGSEGNVGRRLRGAFSDVVGVDRVVGADIVADLDTVDYSDGPLIEAIAAADALIHLGTSPDPEGPVETQLAAAVAGAKLVAACARVELPLLVLASSQWAEPIGPGTWVNAYGRSKRVFEELAAIYDDLPGLTGRSVRLGWVPPDPSHLETAPDWLRDSYWPDEILIAEFEVALSRP